MTQLKTQHPHPLLLEIIVQVLSETNNECSSRIIVSTRALSKKLENKYLKSYALPKIPGLIKAGILTASTPSSNYKGSHQTDNYEVTLKFRQFIYAIQQNSGQPAANWKSFNQIWIKYLDDVNLIDRKAIGFVGSKLSLAKGWGFEYVNISTASRNNNQIVRVKPSSTQDWQVITTAPLSVTQSSPASSLSSAIQTMAGSVQDFSEEVKVPTRQPKYKIVPKKE